MFSLPVCLCLILCLNILSLIMLHVENPEKKEGFGKNVHNFKSHFYI